MQKTFGEGIGKKQILEAADHYSLFLKLDRNSEVLVIYDKTPKNYDPKVALRKDLGTELINKLNETGLGIKSKVLEFDASFSKDQFYQQVTDALNQLDANEKEANGPTTVVILGDNYPEQSGIYKAIDDFGKNKNQKIRMAGSWGFTTGDCQVLSDLNKEKTQQIIETGDRFERFFKEQPEGLFDITTRDIDGKELHLNLPYDTAKAPFVAEFGFFDGVHEHAPGEYKNISYINIPGGEIYGTPYPFQEVTGEFSAEGITFEVANGFLIGIEISKEVNLNTLSTSQQELIKKVKGLKPDDPNYPQLPLPIAELGIGFYEEAGVKTYLDSSILSAEKTGPHIAFGHGFESVEEEKIKELSELSGGFQHADFVLDHPVIESIDENGANRQELYHFIPNGI
jgi:hypothetical protein